MGGWLRGRELGAHLPPQLSPKGSLASKSLSLGQPGQWEAGGGLGSLPAQLWDLRPVS